MNLNLHMNNECAYEYEIEVNIWCEYENEYEHT